MKKVTIIIAGVLMLAVTYFFLWKFYPKNIGMIYGLAVLYALDLYLYWVYHKNIWSGSWVRGSILTFLYALPLLMIIGMAIVSLFKPYDNWNIEFKGYYAGFIFIGYVSKLIPIVLIMLSDFVIIIRKLFRYRKKKNETGEKGMTRSEFIKKAGLATGALFFGTLTLGMFKWVYDFNVIRKKVYLPKLPKEFKGFTIAQISDIHLGSWISKNEFAEAIQIVNDLQPDVIFFTGDLVNYSTDEAYRFEDIMGRLEAPHGIYCTLGNHDYGDYKRWKSKEAKQQNMEEMYDLYKRLGWRLLRNENKILQKGNGQLAVLGVENWGSMKRFQKYGDLKAAMKGAESAPVKLLLSHDPSHWQLKVSKFTSTIDVTFSGHTHGAQFGIEVPGMRWSPSQYVYKYWAGLYSKENPATGQDQYLYVNRGLGSIGYPGRVGILPEITLIELQS
ncbi:MAG: metallophosphoesterase [Bacteroidetes bacterium]|nr:metallophosphoesterase [Bacteroidota bacterium]